MSDDEEFWFCLTHHKVEGKDGCRNQVRIRGVPRPPSGAERRRFADNVNAVRELRTQSLPPRRRSDEDDAHDNKDARPRQEVPVTLAFVRRR